jgi:hypothetical protein
MTPAREAIALPLVFLTVVLLGGLRIADRVALVPPGLFALVLAMLLFAILTRSGALAPERLMSASRPAIANVNGLVVLVTAFVASAQAFALATPEWGLPRLLFDVFLLVLLLNTLAAAPDRVRVLRSLMVVLGSAFTLKFIVLAALSDPVGGRLKQALLIAFEGLTLGTITQEVFHPATGYLAFVTFVLFLLGLALLPSRPGLDAPPAVRLPPSAPELRRARDPD